MAGNSEEVTAHGEATRASQEGVPTPDPTGALYRAFDSYPWQKDQEFAVGSTTSYWGPCTCYVD